MDLPAKQCEEVAEVTDPRNQPLPRNLSSAAEVEVNPDWNCELFVEVTLDLSMLETLEPVEVVKWVDQELEVS